MMLAELKKLSAGTPNAQALVHVRRQNDATQHLINQMKSEYHQDTHAPHIVKTGTIVTMAQITCECARTQEIGLEIDLST